MRLTNCKCHSCIPLADILGKSLRRLRYGFKEKLVVSDDAGAETEKHLVANSAVAPKKKIGGDRIELRRAGFILNNLFPQNVSNGSAK